MADVADIAEQDSLVLRSLSSRRFLRFDSLVTTLCAVPSAHWTGGASALRRLFNERRCGRRQREADRLFGEPGNLIHIDFSRARNPQSTIQHDHVLTHKPP